MGEKTERMDGRQEVEIEVWSQEAEARCDDNGEWHYFNVVPKGSLTAARLRLADAWMADEDASDENRAAINALDPDGDQDAQIARLERAYNRCQVTRAAFEAAAAALRTARGEG